MPDTLTGGCVCGAVRYEVSLRPLMMFNCHCRTCQFVSGGAYVPILLVPIGAFRLTKGSLKHHFTERIAGNRHRRGFCADCGCHITGGEMEGKPSRWVGVAAATLDDPSVFKPQSDIFASHAQPWDRMDASLPKHETYPPKRD